MRNLKFLLLILFLLPLKAFSAESEVAYQIEIIYDYGRTNIGAINISTGYIPPAKAEAELSEPRYSLRIVSDSGKTLFDHAFGLFLDVSYAPPVEGEEYEGPSGMVTSDYVSQIEVVPYFSEAKWLMLLDGNRSLIERKDLSEFAEFCGNGICDEGENSELCEPDCALQEKDITQKALSNSNESLFGNSFMQLKNVIILLFAFLSIVVVVIIIRIYRKK